MKIDENQKVTLTLGQLKRLVKESEDFPYAGKEFTGDTYGIGHATKADEFMSKYEKVFLLRADNEVFIFGANSPEDLFEVSKKSGWFDYDQGDSELLEAVWDLDENGVYDNVPGNSVVDFAFFCLK